MTISIYRSTEVNAPAGIANVAGNAVAVLDVLANGFTGRSGANFTIAYTGTNIRMYRSGIGNQLYTGVDDTGTTSFRIRGFATATAAGVTQTNGTIPTPNDTQVSGGLYSLKSNGASARAWILVTNGKLVYLFVDYAGTSVYNMMWFGEISSKLVGDIYNYGISGFTSATYSNSALLQSITQTQAGQYLMGKFDGSGGSQLYGKYPHKSTSFSVIGSASPNYMGSGGAQYPDPINGGADLSAIMISELNAGAGIKRGRLPGIWSPCHDFTGQANGTIIHGAVGTDLEGKDFEGLKVYTATGSTAYIFFETSDTWDSFNPD